MTRQPRRLRDNQILCSERVAARILDHGGDDLMARIVLHLKNQYPHLRVKRAHWGRLPIAVGANLIVHVVIHPWQSNQLYRAVLVTPEEGDLIVQQPSLPHGAVDGVSPLHPIQICPPKPTAHIKPRRRPHETDPAA